MKRIKPGIFAVLALVAVASLLTVCKATGTGPNVFTTLFDQTIEVGHGELRALQPHEKELLTFSETDLTEFKLNNKTIALSNGDKILGFSVGRIVETGYTLEVYATDWGNTHPGETPAWPDNEPRFPPPRRYYAAPLAANAPQDSIVTGTQGNSGASWQTACSDLQKLVEAAKASYAVLNAPIEIWVAAGTYTAESGTGTVIDISGGTDYLSIYGGFTGNETAAIGSLPAGRSDWFHTHASYNNKLTPDNKYGTVREPARKTTLDAGNVGTDSMVVKVDGTTNITLDGFTLTGGTKSGLWINDGRPTTVFRNLEITNNRNTSGGGIRSAGNGNAPTLDNLTVTGNTATSSYGGGMCFRTVYMVGYKPPAPRVTNAFISENTTSFGGGGIAFSMGGCIIREDAPYASLENIIVTGNTSTGGNGAAGIYNEANVVIVNALVSGNSLNANPGSENNAMTLGGGISTFTNHLVLVNVLVSGNSLKYPGNAPGTTWYPGTRYAGGGGIKVYTYGRLTLVNCTVSGNYASYADQLMRGGGIMVANANKEESAPSEPKGPMTWVKAYNSIIAGNTGLTDLSNAYRYMNGDDGVPADTQFTASNSLVGGYSKALLDSGGEDPYYLNHHANGVIKAGSGNLDGTAYRTPALNVQPSDPSWIELAAVQQLFTAFPATPDENNTGTNPGYNGAAWNFRLNSPPAGVVDGGSAAYLSAPSTTPTYWSVAGQGYADSSATIAPVTTDVEGKTRSAPDLGAYEK